MDKVELAIHRPAVLGHPQYRDVLMSFETGEQGDTHLYFNYRTKINKIRGIVTKALAGTDTGVITPKNNAGTTMTSSALTFAISAALGTAASGTPTANNIIEKDTKMILTSAKTTAGGKVLVSIEFEYVDPSRL